MQYRITPLSCMNPIWLLLLFLFCVGYTHAAQLQVSVSIPPLHFFVEKIAKTNAKIHIIVPNNKNAELYEPTIKDMQTLSQSDIIIGIGMPFESIWLPKIKGANGAQPTMLLLHESMHTNPEHQTDMHLWLSIRNARIITREIASLFSKKDSQNAPLYQQNAAALLQELDKLEAQIQQIVRTMPQKDFIVYHPILNHASHEYGLSEHALEQHGKNYGMQDILALAAFGKQSKIKRIFAEHTNKDIQTLANAMNARVILINPMSKDYMANLLSLFLEIAKSYEE